MKKENREKKRREAQTENPVQKARRDLFRSFVFSLSALSVVTVAGYAWFVNNDRVSGGTGAVTAIEYGFELASLGQEGTFDQDIPGTLQIPGEEWIYLDQSGTITSGRKQSILWRVSLDSQLGNRDSHGIRPGSRGNLEFYVLPKQSGDLDVDFQVELVPLKADKSDFEQDSVIPKLIKGHLLVAYKEGEQNQLVNITDGRFSLSFPKGEEGVPEKVSLQWFWPYVWSEAIEDEQYGSEVEKTAKEHPDYFFYEKQTGEPIEEFQGNSNKTLSNYYNQADQYIGDSVSWLFFKVTAQAQ